MFSICQNHIYCLVREVPGISCKDRLLSTLKTYGILSSTSHMVNGIGDHSVDQDDDTNAIYKKFERRVTAIKGWSFLSISNNNNNSIIHFFV